MCVLFKVICRCEVHEYADACVGVHMLFYIKAKWLLAYLIFVIYSLIVLSACTSI